MFDQFTDDELKAELDRRERARLDKSKPKLIARSDRDVEDVERLCTQYIDAIWEGGYRNKPKDIEHYIFEYAMMMLYGASVFDALNKRDNEVYRCLTN